MNRIAILILLVLAAALPAAPVLAQAPESATPTVTAASPAAPPWARDYVEGLRAWRDIIYYWIDQQHDNGTFGFGWGEDVEMIVGWPSVMMAADDKRIERAIERLCDNRWYNDNIQRGYIARATDPEHGAEPISYSNPVLLYQRYGSPKFIERLMVTAQNTDYWLGETPAGDWHMQSTYFGSQQMYEWEYYHEDSPINARAWIPMMHLLLYNRDPYLQERFLKWVDSWVQHAMDDQWGKPPGFLPGSVTFPTGEVGGYTHNWWGAGAHEFTTLWYRTRLYEAFVVAHELTGDDKYLEPIRALLEFLSTYAKPAVAEGDPLPPDRLPEQYTFPEGWRDGTLSTRWARDAGWGHFHRWYYYQTGDTQFVEAFKKLFPGKDLDFGPYERIDADMVADARRRAESFRDNYFDKVLPSLKHKGSTANYAAAWWAKRYGTMTFGQRCFHDGGNLANSVNWPWVDYPPPAVVWKDTGYDTAIFVLQDDPDKLRIALCNVADVTRNIGMQTFTLAPGNYRLRFGPDADLDGAFDGEVFSATGPVGKGSTFRINLPCGITQIIELERRDTTEPPTIPLLPDVAVDASDIIVSDPTAEPGTEIDVTVRIHNIGADDVRALQVSLLTGTPAEPSRDTIGIVNFIKAPRELQPSYAEVTLPLRVRTGGRFGVRVESASGRTLREIYSGNNEAWVQLADTPTAFPVKRQREVEPARRMGVEDIAEDVSRYDVAYIDGIELDGLVGPAEWADATPFQLIPHKSDTTFHRGTVLRAAYNREALYLSMVCEEPHPEKLKTELPNLTDIYYNDGFEVFLDPGAEVWRYWQFVFDTAGHQFQTKTRNRYAPPVDWQVAVRVGEDHYTAEARFPFAEFDKPAPEPGDRWRMNVMRYTTTITDPEDPERRISERSHFSPRGDLHLHHQPELFGDLYFQARE